MVKAPTKEAPKLLLPSWQCRLSKEAWMNQASESTDARETTLIGDLSREYKELLKESELARSPAFERCTFLVHSYRDKSRETNTLLLIKN